MRVDPLLCDHELPLSGTFYPAGFPLHIATNSHLVLDAATCSWSNFRQEFDVPAMEFRIMVEAGSLACVDPIFRKQGHLLSFVSGAANFATGDCLTLSAAFHLSEALVADQPRFRWFYLEAMAYMLLTQRHVVSLHAACVAGHHGGILLCGKSGAGKSTLSFACARAGFTFLSDDCTWLLTGSDHPVAVGKPHQMRFRHDAARHFPELQDYPAKPLPNGKLSMEVPTNLFPGVRTASRCPISTLVFLERGGDRPAGRERMPACDAVASLLAELPSYGPDVNAIHERAIHALTKLPAWRVHYRALNDAVGLLSEIGAGS